MDERDRQAHPVRLREDRAVEVARVVVEAEDRGGRAADPLALEELGIEGVRVEAARVRKGLGDLAGTVALGVDEPHADLPLEQLARDGGAHLAGAEDDDVVDPLLAAGDHAAPRLRRGGRADDHDAVAGQDHLVAARHDHAVAADQPGHLGVGGDRGLAERTADQRRVGGVAGMSNSTIWTSPSANASV